MIKINNYIVDLVETCRFGLDGGAMFGVVPKALWERAYALADEKNRIPMAAKCLLIRGNEKVILVDTGNSPFMSEKELSIYGIDFSEYSIEGSLSRLGVQPDEITDVILTHLHFDHVGGAVVTENSELLPRFKNATYHVQKQHLSWARNPSLKDRASFVLTMFEPLSNHNVLNVIDGDGELFENVFVNTWHGHTPFMQSVKIVGDQTLFYPADLMPTGAHISLPYGMAYDNEPLKTISEKQSIHDEMISDSWIVVFEHDATRQASIVARNEKGSVVHGRDVVLTSYD